MFAPHHACMSFHLFASRRSLPLLLCLALLLLALPAVAAAQTATCLKEPCPRQDLETRRANFDSVQLSRSARELPLQLSGRSGGPADAPAAEEAEGEACAGFTGVRPDHILTLPRELEGMRLEVGSRGATALIVHGPAGWICSEGGGTRGRPALEGTFAAGTWRVWVASIEMGAYHDYTLSFGTPPAEAPRSPRADAPRTTPQRPDRAPPERVPPIRPAPPTVVPAPAPGPRPHPYPHPRPRPRAQPPIEEAPAPNFALRGRFEELDVFFSVETVAEVHAACMNFAGVSRSLGFVDDVVLHGQAWRNATGFWSAEQLCALVALNARPEGAAAADALARGNVEGVPFEIHGGVDELRTVLRTWLPVAVDMTWADDLEVNGQTRRNRTGYWTLDEIIMLVVSLSAG